MPVPSLFASKTVIVSAYGLSLLEICAALAVCCRGHAGVDEAGIWWKKNKFGRHWRTLCRRRRPPVSTRRRLTLVFGVASFPDAGLDKRRAVKNEVVGDDVVQTVDSDLEIGARLCAVHIDFHERSC